MQSAVIVLLKLLLATVTANNNIGCQGGQPDSGTGSFHISFFFLIDTDVWFVEDAPALGLEDTDIMRHREITSKAVSAILILTLRWFKTSRSSFAL